MMRWSATATRMASRAESAVACSQYMRRSRLSITMAADPATGARLASRAGRPAASPAAPGHMAARQAKALWANRPQTAGSES
eukprot:595308-Alexandrium_andersonii.AAC.1